MTKETAITRIRHHETSYIPSSLVEDIKREKTALDASANPGACHAAPNSSSVIENSSCCDESMYLPSFKAFSLLFTPYIVDWAIFEDLVGWYQLQVKQRVRSFKEQGICPS
jgi:hypothetical protein